MSIKRLVTKLMYGARKAEPLFVFLLRASVGIVFARTGYGKLAHLERTEQFFRELGIPAPEVQALFIGSLELVGGICLALGLLTRVVSVPLAGTMVVAIFTALLPEVSGVLDLLALDETLYLFFFGWLIAHGPDAVSVDHLLTRIVPALGAEREPKTTHELAA